MKNIQEPFKISSVFFPFIVKREQIHTPGEKMYQYFHQQEIYQLD